jgi:hypothetical protein
LGCSHNHEGVIPTLWLAPRCIPMTYRTDR